MPISLDTFQRTLESSNVQGFIKLSGDGDAADVTSVGGGFLARHFGLYTKPTAEENNAVRRAFYESLVNKFHCRGAVLDQLRRDLGIGADGSSTGGARLNVGDATAIFQRVKAVADEESANVKERQAVLDSIKNKGLVAGAIVQHVREKLGLDKPDVAATKLSNADALDIRHYAMDAFTSFGVRDKFYKDLAKDGLCQDEIGVQVRAMLGLGDEEEMLKPLSSQVRDAVVAFARDASAKVHAKRLEAARLPPESDFARCVSPEKLQNCKAVLANAGSTMEQIAEVVRDVNAFSVGQEHGSWSAKIDGALKRLSSDVGADCSSMKDEILSRIEKGLQDKYGDAKGPVVATKVQMGEDFIDALAKVICEKKAMNAILAAAAPKLPKVVVDYLRAALASNVDFGSPAQMKALVDNYDAAMPLQRLRLADNVTEADCLSALATMRAKTGADMVDTPDSRFLCKMFIDMGKAAVEDESGPLPGADVLKPAMEKLVRQLHYVGAQIKQGVDFCCGPSALRSGLTADLMRLHLFADSCGLGGLSDAPPATGAEREISPRLERRLEDYGISHGHLQLDDGQPFNITLRSAFQEAMLTAFQESLAFADRTDLKEFSDIFSQCFADLDRCGGLKVDDTVTVHANEPLTHGLRDAVVAKLEQFFGADKANGIRAARIVGSLVHQGFMGDVMSSVAQTGEPIDSLPHHDVDHIMEFSVRRQADGSYGVHYSGTFLYSGLQKMDSLPWLDPSLSRVNYEVDVNLSFDGTGKPNISFSRAPTMSGRFTKIGLDLYRDVERLESVKDPTNGGDLAKIVQLSGGLGDSEIRQAVFETEATDANKEAAGRLLRSRFLNLEDYHLLKILGFGWQSVEQMASRMAGDDSVPRLGKEIVARLKDPSTRDSAIRDLATMMAPIVRRGWEAQPDVRPEVLNLVTVAGLSTSGYNDACDALRVAEFIKDSQDPGVKKLLVDLQDSDPAVVSAAKARVQQINTDLRRGAGLDILLSHLHGISGKHLELLRKHVPDTQWKNLLKHIVDLDDFFDDALRTFEYLIECAKIIEAGKNPRR